MPPASPDLNLDLSVLSPDLQLVTSVSTSHYSHFVPLLFAECVCAETVSGF